MRPTSKNTLAIAIRLAAIGLVVWFVGGTLLSSFRELRASELSIGWGWLIASGAVYLVALLPMAWFWRQTLRATGTDASWRETLAAYYLGHLGKYVPGKVMVVVLRTNALRGEGRQTRHIAATVFVETLTMMAVGAAMACLLIANRGPILSASPWLLPMGALLAVVAVVPTLPPVMRRILQLMAKPNSSQETANQSTGPFNVGWSLIAAGWLAGFVTWLGLAGSVWVAVRSVEASLTIDFVTAEQFLLAATLPVVAGFLSLLPGGVGVRDGLMLMVLAGLLAQPIALAAVILVRLVWVISEGLAYVIIEGLRRMHPM